MADETADIVDAAAARDLLIAAAGEAGRIALPFFRAGEKTSARIDYKQGGSPVTEADLAVDSFLKIRLAAAFPGAGWLSEETVDAQDRLRDARVIVVDPIDGTRGFVAGDPRWTVSIALVVSGRPIAGVIHAPALDETYAAAAGLGATFNGQSIGVSSRQSLDGARVAGPRAIFQSIERAAGLSLTIEPKIPSLAYRLALVASGALDLGLASDNAHDWDIAAADLILSEAGGALVDCEGTGLRYDRAETRHPVLFAASRKLVRPFVAAFGLARGGQSSAQASAS